MYFISKQYQGHLSPTRIMKRSATSRGAALWLNTNLPQS
jgi:hypothetical protein